ncbi:hypothetical protein H3C66_03830 [Patescibacteria group bacterium]|nr:hypothetical protein [Patescibacteria group bacterium]
MSHPPELGKRILNELRVATNQPLRHEAASHPFWTSLNLNRIPDKIVIATSSYRKVVLFTLQFLALNEEAMPPFFEEFGGDPLVFLKTIKAAFSNKNGESNAEFYVGELFGVPIYAQPTEGEKHEEDLTQRDEALNKALWLAMHPYNDEPNYNTWYVGVDALDTIWEETSGGLTPLGRLPKPSSWSTFPKDFETNPEEYRRFKLHTIMSRFPQNGVLEGVTAGVIVDGDRNERSVGFTSVSTRIDQHKLLEVIDQFDHNASAFGVLQLLVDLERESFGEDGDKMLEFYFPDLPPEKRKLAGFFLLAQIMGSPALLILELVAAAGSPGMEEHEKAAVVSQMRQFKPLPGEEDKSSYGPGYAAV